MPVNQAGSLISMPLLSAASTGKDMFMYTCLRLNKSASTSTCSSFLGYSIYSDLIRVFRRTDSDPAVVMGCMGIKAISAFKDHIATNLYETWFTLKLIFSVE